ncbi:MAG: copper homeostasis protein CutC [Flavobacteriaceae bacterium]
MLVEVCANSLESALNAEKAGADRIELCSELAVGGITPSYGLLQSVKEKVSIPIHVLIRPRSGDFTYSDLEFDIMKRNIALCVNLGFEGIVSGVLHKDFTLDVERTRELIELSNGLNFTFHRAFDWVKDPKAVLAQLELLGVDCILSSGQGKSSVEGIKLLSELDERTMKCLIMPGGGIRADNVHQFKKKGFSAIHLSGSKFIKTLDVAPKVSMNSPLFLKDDAISVTGVELIKKIVNEV